MNHGRDTLPLEDPDDDTLADRTVMVSRRTSPPAGTATVLRAGPPPKPPRDTAPLEDPDDDTLADRTVMVSRRSDPPTDATVMVARQSDPPTDATVMVSRRSDPPTDATVMVARQSGPPTDGTVVVHPADPDGTVMVRRGRPSGVAMADPVLRGPGGLAGVPKPPLSLPEERPRYTPRAIPLPPGPPLQVVEGPTALRGTAPLPSVAAASRRTARVALVVWLLLSAACAVGVVWCASELFGGWSS
ncbi:MAG: hypothetical protein FWH11_09050 [Micrococcales bacterium]|nr:hypothetical protein [Micrococcales bacterium]